MLLNDSRFGLGEGVSEAQTLHNDTSLEAIFPRDLMAGQDQAASYNPSDESWGFPPTMAYADLVTATSLPCENTLDSAVLPDRPASSAAFTLSSAWYSPSPSEQLAAAVETTTCSEVAWDTVLHGLGYLTPTQKGDLMSVLTQEASYVTADSVPFALQLQQVPN